MIPDSQRILKIVNNNPDDTPQYWRPSTYGECLELPRPCPYLGCRYHLGAYVSNKGTLYASDPTSMRETCALDVANRGTLSFEELGSLFGFTRERARQICEIAMEKLRHRADRETMAVNGNRTGGKCVTFAQSRQLLEAYVAIKSAGATSRQLRQFLAEHHITKYQMYYWAKRDLGRGVLSQIGRDNYNDEINERILDILDNATKPMLSREVAALLPKIKGAAVRNRLVKLFRRGRITATKLRGGRILLYAAKRSAVERSSPRRR